MRRGAADKSETRQSGRLAAVGCQRASCAILEGDPKLRGIQNGECIREVFPVPIG
jgi:hypothetical protein